MKVLLAPRWLALHLFALAAIGMCLLGARWQWDRAHRSVAEVLPDVAPIEIGPAGVAPGAVVAVAGTWEQRLQFVVPARRGGADGAWVLSALKPASGDAVAIVRGWVGAEGDGLPGLPGLPRQVPPLAPGAVRVVGPFLPDELGKAQVASPSSSASGAAPEGAVVIDRVDTAAMSAQLGYPVRTGWVALQSVQPGGLPGDPSPLAVAELPGAEVGISWRNAAYAVQWLAFAAFAAYFWFRFVRDEVGGRAAPEVSGGIL